MKKLFLSTLLLLLPLLASAYDFEAKNADDVTIYYNIINEGTELEVTSGNGYSGDINIPEKVTYNGNPLPVTTIGSSAFENCSGLTSVTIPNSVTTIGDCAFYASEDLTSVNIPNSVTTIGHSTFHYCYKLSSVTIPNSVTSIGDGAFGYCTSLTSVTIPQSVTTIGYAAFGWCPSLTSVNVESGNTVYDSRDNCNAIIETATNTLIQGSNTTIIPNSVTDIGVWAFRGCSNLTSVTIPNSVNGIAEYGFAECSSLTSLTIPNSITNISLGAFYFCSGLTSLTIPNSVTNIETNAFNGCSGLTSVDIPNSVTRIGDYSFSNCTGLTSVTIPNSVTTFGDHAFVGCTNLTSVTIGKSVSSIGTEAFAECTNLTSVTSRMKDPCPIDSKCFPADVYTNATLYVPQGTSDIYTKVDMGYWRKFDIIEEFEACATPTIGYGNKKLTFSCDTEDVEYHCTITDADIKSYVAGSIDLSATYQISVYATKEGYEDSDEATATLVWMSAQMEGAEPIVTPANAPAESVPVLISSRDGKLTVKSELEGQPVAVYTIDGKALGSAQVKGGQAVIATHLTKGTIVVVKVGDRSVKISI